PRAAIRRSPRRASRGQASEVSFAEAMPREIEFFYDYGSPYSYLANAVLPDLAQRHAAELLYRPMLLGAVFKATGNQSPIQLPVAAKRAYGGLTLRRAASYYGVAISQ